MAKFPDYCPRCMGEGVIHTGVGECPTKQCDLCDGTGEPDGDAAEAAENGL